MAPDRGVWCCGVLVPRGTPMSMSAMLMHHNEEVFPQPLVFRPERWLDAGERRRAERFLVNFSRGTRACVGV